MKWRVWTVFAVVCVWAASGWLITPGSDALPRLERQGLGFAVLAGVALASGGCRNWRARLRLHGAVSMGGVLFFAVPAVLIEHAREYAAETSVAVVFALAPVVVVLVWGAVMQEPGAMRWLVPALTGLAGVLLLLPFEMPVSTRGWEAVAEIVAAMLLVAGAGVWLFGLLREMSTTKALTVVGAANAIVLFVCCGALGSLDWRWRDVVRGLSWESAVAVIVAALTVWLLQAMDPIRFSARFLVIPLMTILEGAVLLRPEVTGRMAVGIVLLAGGATWMLGAKQVEEKILTLR